MKLSKKTVKELKLNSEETSPSNSNKEAHLHPSRVIEPKPMKKERDLPQGLSFK